MLHVIGSLTNEEYKNDTCQNSMHPISLITRWINVIKQKGVPQGNGMPTIITTS